MTDEEKIKHIQMMIAAIRVTSRAMINLNYQLARLHDSASFVLTMSEADVIRHRSRLDVDYVVAETIVASEK